MKKTSWQKYIASFSVALIFCITSFQSFSQSGKYEITFSGSPYAKALNESELFYDPFGESSHQYKTTNYLDLTFNKIVLENNLIGICIGYHRSVLFGSSHNPFPSFGSNNWEWMYSEYDEYATGYRIGLKLRHRFNLDKKITPFIGASVQWSKNLNWTRRSDATYHHGVLAEYKTEEVITVYDQPGSQLYYDLRLGAEFALTDRFSLLVGAEVLTSATRLTPNQFTEDIIKRWEFGVPVGIIVKL